MPRRGAGRIHMHMQLTCEEHQMPITTGTTADTTAVSSETAQHVLWQFSRGGYAPGSFTQHLMNAMAAADPTNFARLALAFPELAAAVDLAQNHEDGITRLQQIADGGAA